MRKELLIGPEVPEKRGHSGHSLKEWMMGFHKAKHRGRACKAPAKALGH